MLPESIRHNSVRNNAATVFFGLLYIAGNMSNAIYPLFVSALTNTPETSTANVGSLAAAEFLAYGLVILFAGKIVPKKNLRGTVILCLALQLLTACATTLVPHGALMGCRLLYGAVSGILAWISYGYIAQAVHPGRLAAMYTAGLMSVASLWSILGSEVVAPRYGYAAIFVFITIMSPVAVVLIRFCPGTLSHKPDRAAATPCAASSIAFSPLIALLSVGFFSAYTSIFWVYSESIAHHLSGPLLKYWLTISLVCQIFGAMCAAVFVERLPFAPTLTVGFGLLIMQMIVMITGVSGTGFVIWGGIYGFLGYFLIPFFVRALAHMDHTNAMIPYIPAAQLLAASLGPLFVSLIFQETDLTGGLGIGLAAIIITPLCFWSAVLISRRSHAHA